ncbi:MAG: hypothetical protein ACPLUK_03775 [Caldisericum exile]
MYNHGKSLAELSSEYGISKSTISGWLKKAKPINIENKGTPITVEEYQAMLKKVARLEEKNEILKKAMAIFAKE